MPLARQERFARAHDVTRPHATGREQMTATAKPYISLSIMVLIGTDGSRVVTHVDRQRSGMGPTVVNKKRGKYARQLLLQLREKVRPPLPFNRCTVYRSNHHPQCPLPQHRPPPPPPRPTLL